MRDTRDWKVASSIHLFVPEQNIGEICNLVSKPFRQQWKHSIFFW